MAVVDPYSPCPCGSGQKFKWCCHKVEAYAERAQRLFEGNQIEKAVEALDEGLKKEPGNSWLLSRKAVYLINTGHMAEAKQALAETLRTNPANYSARLLMTRLVIETEGPKAGIHQIQQALGVVPETNRVLLAPIAQAIGLMLIQDGELPSAIAHLRLAKTLSPGGDDRRMANSIASFERDATVSPWLKNRDTLLPPPPELKGDALDRFNQAIAWANEGLWESAAAAFELLTADRVAGPRADHNLGFCRLWLGEDVDAVAALRRYVARLGITTEAVDLEALCQEVAPPGSGGTVEEVQLTWPIRNRQALLDRLKADAAVSDDGEGPIDPEDEDSPVVDQFALLDRPEPKHVGPDLKLGEVPCIVGRVYVGTEIVTLETFDDGRLDSLSERFTQLSGPAIPPAHPKMKTIGHHSRVELALRREWLLPEGIDPATAFRLRQEQTAILLGDTWPNTPNPALRNLTPLKAAASGDAEVPLRAALMAFEQGRLLRHSQFDFAALRQRLHIPPEPEIDPTTVDLGALHLARLVYVPAEKLDDEKLGQLYRLGSEMGLSLVIERAGKLLIERPGALAKADVSSIHVYADLATLTASRGQIEEALALLKQGREAEPPLTRRENAVVWDIVEIRLRARFEEPHQWVPELAAIIDRYSEDPKSTEFVVMSLIEMGLLQMVPAGEGQVSLDSRPLQALMSEFGPRVTTASGRLGVSAAKPDIWTPGSSTGSSGGLYIPGASTPPNAPQGGGPSKLIVPGR